MIKKLKYGKTELSLRINKKNIIAELVPNSIVVSTKGEEEVKRSLLSPIGTERLSVLARGKKNIVIVTSDISRPCPSYKIIPSLLDELSLAGVRDDQITIVLAVGSHRGHTDDEKKHLVGEKAFERVKVIDSNSGEYVRLGQTSRGTPLDIFKPVADADLKICVGNIEFHYFAGYSGGAKALMPGVSSRDAIQANHKMMVKEQCCAGNLSGNDIRDDIEEAGSIIGIDFICNVVLDEKKEIVYAVSGDAVAAHRKGCEFLDRLYKKEIPSKADIVIVSAGGFPKDMNMYQAQKALDNAKHAVKDGGTIIWVAECTEGFGEKTFESWITGHDDPEKIIEHLHKEFKLGGHKAAAIALVLRRAKIVLVSRYDKGFVRSLHLEGESSLQEAYDKAKMNYGKDHTVILMPIGGSTLPYVR